MEAAIENPKRPRGAKQSFNLEPDVERGLIRYWRGNPMVIKSRVYNAALREWLASRKRKGQA
jgi:hypothetical protein